MKHSTQMTVQFLELTHTHNDTHEGLSLKLFGTKVAFKKQKRQREKCPQESLREVKMKKAEMHLFQSLCLEVIRWQNCSENLAACPSTEIKHKDTAPSFKVVLLQNLKMQFVRLAKLSEESINTASKNLPKKNTKKLRQQKSFSLPEGEQVHHPNLQTAYLIFDINSSTT